MSASKTEGVTASRVVEKNYFQSFWDQLVIMLRRNTILQIRYTRATLAQTVIAPFIFQLLLFILQQADYANQRQSIPHPTPAALPALTKCQGHNPGDPCITLMFAPDIPLYNQIVTEFGRMNGERGVKLNYAGGAPASLPNSLDIVGASSADFVYDYILANPNRTRWAITFNQPTATNYTNIQYQIWFNTSLTANSSDVFGSEMLTVTRGIDEAIMTVLNPGSTATRIDVTLKDWPKIPPSTLSDTVVQSLGPVFFFCTEMVIFINVLNQIVAEKEAKLRHGMEMMGLKPSVYWISHFLSNTLLVFVSSLVTTIFGLIFQFTAFKETHFMVLWITFFLFGLGMVMLAFFITTLVRRVRVAVLIGIFLFIIGLLFESFVFSSSFVGYIWWSKETMPSSGWQFLMFIPFFNFGHMFLDITMYTTGKLDTLTQTYIPGPGFQWSTLYNPLPTSLRPVYGSTSAFPDVPVPVQAWDFLIMNCFFYAVLVWYFDCVIPDEYGRKMPLWFFLTPDYWGIDLWRSKELDSKQWLLGITPKKDNAPSGPLDTDVVAERERALDESRSKYIMEGIFLSRGSETSYLFSLKITGRP
ncbi:ATP-binding cassette sub- A member 1 [Borealophlyctis nickersoniae]|nr:ATP-binding cassette sub- A member 1 [Borealophlyctis nickersoniae]